MEITDETLKQKTFAIRHEFEKAPKRSQQWKAYTKDEIERVLKSIAINYALKCFVQPSVFDGQEFVQLQIDDQESVTDPKHRRKGGVLSYYLTHRGRVLVFITNPRWEVDDDEVQKAFVIGNESIEPSEINRNLIISHVDKFLDHILNWETNRSYPLGFQRGNEKLSLSDQTGAEN